MLRYHYDDAFDDDDVYVYPPPIIPNQEDQEGEIRTQSEETAEEEDIYFSDYPQSKPLSTVHQQEKVKQKSEVPEETIWDFSKRKDESLFDETEIEEIPRFYQQQVEVDTDLSSGDHTYLRKLVEK